MTKFKEDLARWLEFEEVVLDKLNEDWDFNLVKNPDVKWMDLLIVENWIEVKADHYNYHKWKTTNQNAYIEYEAYWKQSGIFKEEKACLKYWVHSLSPDEFYLLDWWTFKRWVADKIRRCEWWKIYQWCKIVTWGDGNKTKGLLVPVELLEKQAIKIYNL